MSNRLYNTPTHSTAALTTTSAEVLAANRQRKYALLVNDGTVDAYVFLGGTAVANQGVRINANGGSFEMSELMGNLYKGVINGILAAGTATMLITEGV